MFVGKENASQGANTLGDGSHVNGMQTEEPAQLREEVEELRSQHALLETQLREKDAIIDSLVSCDFSLCTTLNTTVFIEHF